MDLPFLSTMHKSFLPVERFLNAIIYKVHIKNRLTEPLTVDRFFNLHEGLS